MIRHSHCRLSPSATCLQKVDTFVTRSISSCCGSGSPSGETLYSTGEDVQRLSGGQLCPGVKDGFQTPWTWQNVLAGLSQWQNTASSDYSATRRCRPLHTQDNASTFVDHRPQPLGHPRMLSWAGDGRAESHNPRNPRGTPCYPVSATAAAAPRTMGGFGPWGASSGVTAPGGQAQGGVGSHECQAGILEPLGPWGASFGVTGSDGQAQGDAGSRGRLAGILKPDPGEQKPYERRATPHPHASRDAQEETAWPPGKPHMSRVATESQHSGIQRLACGSAACLPNAQWGRSAVPWPTPFAFPSVCSHPLGRTQKSRVVLHRQMHLPRCFSASAACPADSASSQSGAGHTGGKVGEGSTRGGPGSNRQLVHPVYNLANAISMGRLVSGPVVAGLIIQQQWAPALALLVAGGVSDWLDGFVAKQYAQPSVLGSYLDPLADKVLICCTVGALGYEGSLPGFLVAIIIGRDVILVGGAVAERFRSIGWRWPGIAEFLRVSPAKSPSTPDLDSAPLGQSVDVKTPLGRQSMSEGGKGLQYREGEGETGLPNQAVPPAQLVKPSLISKLNTVLQFGLVGGCLTHSWYLWPEPAVLWGLGGVTAVTTVTSGALYLRDYVKARK